jgi:MFS family permease
MAWPIFFGAKARFPGHHPLKSMVSTEPPRIRPLPFVVLAMICVLAGWLGAEKMALGMGPAVVLGSLLFGIGCYALTKLEGAPRDLWCTFGLKFFSVVAYKILNVALIAWLAQDLGMGKAAAFSVIGAWGMTMTIATLLSGSLTDAIGIRRTLLFGLGICLVTRVVMLGIGQKYVALCCGLFPLAIGEALCTPVLVAAMRRSTTPTQRSVAFSLFYALMNLAFLVAYLLRDGLQSAGVATAGGNPVLTFAGFELTVPQGLILLSLALELFLLPLIWMLKADAAELHETPLADRPTSVWGAISKAASDTFGLLGKLVHSRGFYRLLCFLIFIGLLKVVFNIMDYVLPDFMRLELGRAGEDRAGRLNAINGILILLLAPLIGVWTRRFSAYNMVIFGGLITAGSFCFMALPTTHFQGLADGWLGKFIGNDYLDLPGAVHPWFVMIALWQVFFSIGEAFYSPRVYEYAASIAPPGQEASYASLSYIPLLIGKLITGGVFGGLVAKYIPDSGPRDPATLWAIIGSLVAAAPLGLLLFRRYIQVREVGRE